jgi:hypothetical protein
MFEHLPVAEIVARLDRPIEFEKRIKEPEWKVRKAVLEEVEGLCGSPPR